MEKQFDGFLSQPNVAKGDDEVSRPHPTYDERRSSFFDASAGDFDARGHEQTDLHGLENRTVYSDLSMIRGENRRNTMTMTPTTQFLEQPEIFNVKKGGQASSVSGTAGRGGAGGPLDDLLIDLEHLSPPIVQTCIAGLLGLALGTVLNMVGAGVVAQNWVTLPGFFFVMALECVSLPLIFTSVTVGFANLIMSKKTGLVTAWLGVCFLASSFLSCCVALAVGYAFSGAFARKPDLPTVMLNARLKLMCPNGLYLATDSSVCSGKQLRDAMDFVATNITGISLTVAGEPLTDMPLAQQIVFFFDNLFAENITMAFSGSAFLAVTIFSLFLGAGIVLAHDPTSGEQNHVVVLIKQVNLVLEMILNWIVPWTPVGTFFAVTYYIMEGTITQDAFQETAFVVLAMAAALAANFVFVTCASYLLFVRKNPLQFFWFLLPSLIFMVGSNNYTATVPVLLRTIESSKQISRTLSQYTVCLGVALCLPGTAAFFTLGCVFMAYTSGVEDVLSPGKVIALLVVSTLSSIGVPHQAGVGMTYLATIWATVFRVPLPASFMYLRMAEWLVQRMRRMQNVLVVAFIARIVAEQLDETVEDEEDRLQADRPVGLAHM
ncbi:hypothetical protein PybrP1_008302 [[Pythium] brassicae (nom. inval.)]|nr:hypothetical protein PybrP1_008302 [[Pythium] brassicae (nom. inval.)]